MTEWKDLPTFQDVAEAQAQGWEIEVQVDAGNDKYCPWKPWKQETWSFTYLFRARPAQPKMKKVKMLCYFDTVINQLIWSAAEAISGWIRVPSEDKEIEIPDDN